MSLQEIQNALEKGKMEEKLRALKCLIVQIIHDDTFPRLLMVIIKSLLPIQTDNHDIKKALLIYWEIIEKINADGKLKPEMILVCNSLRNDLLHPNEFIRGRTLRLVSRIMYKQVLEPLSSTILDNLTHKHTYVRKNAIVCLYQIYLNFGNEIASDLDEQMEKILQTETDISTKRNAFLLLFHTNQQKAMQFLNAQITSDQAEEMGDILQLAILELFRYRFHRLHRTHRTHRLH